MAPPSAAARYLKYMGLILPFRKFILHYSLHTKKPDKKQTFQSVSYPAVVSLNNSPSERTSRIVAHAPLEVKRQIRVNTAGNSRAVRDRLL